MRISIIILSLLAAAAASAQGLRSASTYLTSPVATNYYHPFPAVTPQASTVYAVIACNSAASDTWVHVVDTNGLPANGTVAHFTPIKVSAGDTRSFDFGLYGLPLTNGLTVVNSTTDRAITNGTASLIITLIYTKRP